MNTTDAVAAIRDLDALPDARRRHLTMLVADAPSDSDRARLVFLARDEHRRVRQQTEAALKAEFSSRARWAEDNPERPTQGAQKPAGVRRWAEEGTTHAGPRPVTITWGPITKTATEKQTRERKPLMGKNKKYADERVPVPKAKPEPKPKVLPEHGTISRYTNQKCRCADCRAAKSATNRREREKRAAQRAERAARRSAQSVDPAV